VGKGKCAERHRMWEEIGTSFEFFKIQKMGQMNWNGINFSSN
jgi:hypothetical protein